jgi:hypothetical protein
MMKNLKESITLFKQKKEKLNIKNESRFVPFAIFTIIFFSCIFYYDNPFLFNMHLLSFFITTVILTYIPFYHCYIPYKKAIDNIKIIKETDLLQHYEQNTIYQKEFENFSDFIDNLDSIETL